MTDMLHAIVLMSMLASPASIERARQLFEAAKYAEAKAELLQSGVRSAAVAAEIAKRDALRGAMARGMLGEAEKDTGAQIVAYQEAIAAAPDDSAGYFALGTLCARRQGDRRIRDAEPVRRPASRRSVGFVPRRSVRRPQRRAARQGRVRARAVPFHAARGRACRKSRRGEPLAGADCREARREGRSARAVSERARDNPKSQISQRALGALK